ncbi:hydroxymethylglutaryl-CoA reductase (NADPH) [Candidatus Woesebacteria bacterium RBG_13_34_9]|uniref:3-hydroxy-3-methylglutaryl coenzyme A reductase n=1 Tax=Candidatus Woesebacteria bacterium RBG_13_34_9 TaxID=1802477 RepID=A0A1F7X2Y8_9BACT|nr:MAG: hydroxymethylglutaryl-CoA reductase (NADPH) [Candidatus Woesebacteria bacterium RBG_13_34_9]
MIKKKQKAFEKIVKEKKFHSQFNNLCFEDQMDIRRQALEKLTHTKLQYINHPSFNIEHVSTKNCENLIGKVEIPLGIAGPLKIHGNYAKGNFYIPLATTEGALIASVNRGCKAVDRSGGAQVFIEKSGMTRAPLFRTKGLKQTKKFIAWINTHLKEIAERVHKTDSHLTLLSITPFIVGRNVFLRFVFDTQDAMGMNMVTIACNYIRNYIEKEMKVECVALSGNVCTDKKPSWINKIEGRGYSVHAEARIPKNIIREILKTDLEKIIEVHINKNLVGSSISGSMGFNAHHVNIIAAIFAATGQDLAQVVEGSIGNTIFEKTGEDLYASVSIPDLPLGTVGGGTQLETQKEALSILGVAGGGNPPGSHAKKLAEIVVSATLAGEISLISSLAQGSLAHAHQKLGR